MWKNLSLQQIFVTYCFLRDICKRKLTLTDVDNEKSKLVNE